MADDDPSWDAPQRMLLGRLIETDPRWAPRIPGPPRPVVPRSDGAVLHLLKESAPHLTNGFTMRSRYNLIAQRDAGLRPGRGDVAGLPAPAGDDVLRAPVRDLDGIPHHRLDLGPAYELDQPFDVLLGDQAWLTARHRAGGAAGDHPRVVGAPWVRDRAGRRGAPGDHVQRPLVYEVRSFFESTWSADEAGNESAASSTGCATRRRRARCGPADHVLTIAESMRDDIIARGIPPERVTVIPNGVDAEAFRPSRPDPELPAPLRAGRPVRRSATSATSTTRARTRSC